MPTPNTVSFLDCPECAMPAELEFQFFVNDISCASLLCVQGHRFTATIDWLKEQGFDPKLITLAKSSEIFRQWLEEIFKRFHEG